MTVAARAAFTPSLSAEPEPGTFELAHRQLGPMLMIFLQLGSTYGDYATVPAAGSALRAEGEGCSCGWRADVRDCSGEPLTPSPARTTSATGHR